MIFLVKPAYTVERRINLELGKNTAIETVIKVGALDMPALSFAQDTAIYYSNDMDYIILHRGKDICTVALSEFKDLIVA